jgi:hypothetical protein
LQPVFDQSVRPREQALDGDYRLRAGVFGKLCVGGASVERIMDALRRHSGWMLGIAALAAWLVMLWKMFGDVL